MKDVLKAVIQLIGFVLLVPMLYAAVVSFKGEFVTIPAAKEAALFQGALVFLVLFLFVYDFSELFEFTLQWMSKVFAFTGSLSSAVGYIIPIYVIVAIVGNLILIAIEKAAGLETLFLNTMGFLLIMQWVISAKHLYTNDGSLLKSQYFLVYSLLFLSHLLIGAFLLNWVISEFSSWSFLINSYNLAKANYLQIYHFLFVDVGR